MEKNMKKVSVIVPCFNEEETIESFYNALSVFWNNIGQYDLEMVFVDDGSNDGTKERIRKLSNADNRVKITAFSRNFGKEAAIFCGLKQASGDAVVVMDADLQHPVETISQMLDKWEEGFDIVEGIKKARGDEPKAHGLFAKMFYKLISKMVGFDMNNSSDFKLMDRKVVDVLNGLEERVTFFRALTFWVGFSSAVVEYEVQDRVAGETKWSTRSLIKYAVYNLTSFTYAPLYFIAVVGGLVMFIGLILGIDAVVSFCMGKSMSGYPSLIILLLLSTGAIMLSLGIIALYIGRIFEEIKKRPRYIVKEEK